MYFGALLGELMPSCCLRGVPSRRSTVGSLDIHPGLDLSMHLIGDILVVSWNRVHHNEEDGWQGGISGFYVTIRGQRL